MTSIAIPPAVQETRQRVRSVLSADNPPRWEHTTIDLRHQLKAGLIPVWCINLLARLGVSRGVLDSLWPPLLHLEALVYRGDLDYEHAQRHGTPVRSGWRDGIAEMLRAYQYNDQVMLAHLVELDDYFRLETSIMAGHTTLTADLIRSTCYPRSADLALLLRFACRLAGLQPDDEFLQLMRHVVAFGEIRGDLNSYTDDVADNSFNVYRLSTWAFGPDAAAARLRGLANEIKQDLYQDIATADRSTLLLFAAALPTFTPPGRHLPPIPTKLLSLQPVPAHLRLRLARHKISRTLEFLHRLHFPQPLPDPQPIPH
jgi:hypothetical protein